MKTNRITRLNRDNPSGPMKGREFLGKSGALALGVGFGPRLSARADAAQPGQINATKLGWKISVPHYTAIDFEHDTPALQDDMVKNITFAEEQARQLLAG
jgi:hypothetical protein